MKSTTAQRGLSLIESMVTLAAIAIAVAATSPDLQAVLDARRLDGAARELGADLQLARHESIARNQAVRLSWYATARCHVVHTGSAPQCRCEAEGPAVCSGDAQQIKTVRWPASGRVALEANVTSIAFDPLHGTASPTATFEVASASGRAVRQVVNLMGRVRSCAPQGTVPGFAAC